MKRVGNLLNEIASFDNLMTAFRLAWKGSGKTAESCQYSFNLESETLRLRSDLLKGAYRPEKHHHFTIYDPKERIIAVAPFRDRVVHHAIVRILTPIYEPIFIYDSYATRPGKGTHAAIKRTQRFVRRWPWYLKMDVERYFYRVDHDVLMAFLTRKIKDRELISLLERIVRNTPTPGKGLPIGNLTSQFWANVYLDPLDHEIKDALGVKGYIRYMDDLVLFGRSKTELMNMKIIVEDYLNHHLKLHLKPEATCLNRSSHGLSFLGMRVFPSFIRVHPANRRRSLKRMTMAVKRWQLGEITEEKMSQSVASYVGHLRYFCPNMNIALETGAV